MKVIHICFHYTRQTYIFIDHNKADVAYAKIKKAMVDWEEFRNKREEAVSVEGDEGELTIRVGEITATSIETPSLTLQSQKEWAEYAGEIQASFNAKLPKKD